MGLVSALFGTRTAGPGKNRASAATYALGEWYRPGGLKEGKASDVPRAQRVPEPTQGYNAFLEYADFMPMRRQLGGVRQVWVDTLRTLPTTTYPLLIPTVVRSALQPHSMWRTSFQNHGEPNAAQQMRRTAYPIQENANTMLDYRWRAGRLMAPGTPGRTPSGATQPGYSWQRRALRVPRYSTIPRMADARPGLP